MTTIKDPEVQKLLSEPNHAVVSTMNQDGSVHNTVAWINIDGGAAAVNSALGRKWPANLERDPRITVLVYDQGNPQNYVEIRGAAMATRDGADEHIDALSKKYIGQDKYPFRQPGEERIKFVIRPEHIRHQKQG